MRCNLLYYIAEFVFIRATHSIHTGLDKVSCLEKLGMFFKKIAMRFNTLEQQNLPPSNIRLIYFKGTIKEMEQIFKKGNCLINWRIILVLDPALWLT